MSVMCMRQDVHRTCVLVPTTYAGCIFALTLSFWLRFLPRAARYNTGLLIKLTPKGVVFSFLFLRFLRCGCTTQLLPVYSRHRSDFLVKHQSLQACSNVTLFSPVVVLYLSTFFSSQMRWHAPMFSQPQAAWSHICLITLSEISSKENDMLQLCACNRWNCSCQQILTGAGCWRSQTTGQCLICKICGKANRVHCCCG